MPRPWLSWATTWWVSTSTSARSSPCRRRGRRSSSRGSRSCWSARWPPAGCGSPPTSARRPGRQCTSSVSARRRSAESTPRTCASWRRRRSRCSTCWLLESSWWASPPCRWGPRRGCPRWSSARCPARSWPGTPEFLREGFAVADTLHPDRLVYGLPAGADGETARARLDEVYAPIVQRGTPKVETDYATAEMVKTAANSFLATKISFINAMAELCEATGADVKQLADAIGYDDRIGRKFLNAGLGFGGG